MITTDLGMLIGAGQAYELPLLLHSFNQWNRLLAIHQS
jgi:hypothetical protein